MLLFGPFWLNKIFYFGLAPAKILNVLSDVSKPGIFNEFTS